MEKLLIMLFACVVIIFAAGCVKTVPLPMELISRDVPSYCPPVKTDQDNLDKKNNTSGRNTSEASSSCKPASNANNANYNDAWRSRQTPSASHPVWLAYDLSGVAAEKRQSVLLVWYNEDTSPYDHTLITAVPNPGYNNMGAYTVEVNPAPGGIVPETGWIIVSTIGNNKLHSQQHMVRLAGNNWIRISAIESDGTKDNTDISLNMDIYDASKGVEDNWLFIGDSITQMSMHHQDMKCSLGSGSFSELIHAALPKHFPVQENGGTGYMQSSDGAKNIVSWVSKFPGKYVALSYGTNDAWNAMAPEEFYNNYKIMVEAVLRSGKVPFVPRIPWSATIEKIQTHGIELNKQIERIYKEYPKVIKGPDFWEMYKKQPGLVSPDGVHPSWPDGLFAYRKAWADLALEKVYK